MCPEEVVEGLEGKSDEDQLKTLSSLEKEARGVTSLLSAAS